MTVADCKKKLERLRTGDTISVNVILRHDHFCYRRPYEITVECNRSVWPAPYRRSGRTNKWLIGYSTTKELAAKRAAAILAMLQRTKAKTEKA